MKIWTHADLVTRAARWLENTYGCKVVLTGCAADNGEIPDAIGWKYNGRSILVECKASRADFKADADKPFRLNPVLGLGAERYYFTEAGLLRPDEIPSDWGLVEAKGNGCKVVIPCRPRKDLRSDAARNYEMRALVSALGRVAGRLAPARLNDWLAYEHRNTSFVEMQNWTSKEDHEQFLSTSMGFELVINPEDLPMDEATQEAWCPKHEMLFELCRCIGPNELHVEYREIAGRLMGKPTATHLFKFPQRTCFEDHQVSIRTPGEEKHSDQLSC